MVRLPADDKSGVSSRVEFKRGWRKITTSIGTLSYLALKLKSRRQRQVNSSRSLTHSTTRVRLSVLTFACLTIDCALACMAAPSDCGREVARRLQKPAVNIHVLFACAVCCARPLARWAEYCLSVCLSICPSVDLSIYLSFEVWLSFDSHAALQHTNATSRAQS